MKSIIQSNNYRTQSAKNLVEIFVEKAILLILRQSFHQIYLHSIREDSYDHTPEGLDDTNLGEPQRNHSFIEGSERPFLRSNLSSALPTLIPQKSYKKLEKDQEGDKASLALNPNRSFSKVQTFIKDVEGPVEKVSEFNPSDLKWAPQAAYEDDKKFKLDVFSVQTKSYVSSNLRIGDIIYFKYVVEHTFRKDKDGRPHRIVGILSGDGIASNRLECVERVGSSKNANFLFKRSLFRVEPSSKYYYQKLYQKMRDTDRESDSALHEGKISFLKKKYDEEKEENESEFRNQLGQPVLYGQLIHLKHLYSNSYLTLQPNALSLQYGCVKLTLEEQGSEMSNFKFNASGNLKSQEDVVSYSDPVHIANSRGDYFMHVWDEANPRNTTESGLEVNGAETSSNWKLLRFMDFEEYQEYENNANFLESGDIVKVVHKKTGATLSVPPKNLGPIISTRDIFINNDAEDNYGPQRTSVVTKIIESKIPALPLDLETPAKYTVSDLWEVQRRNAFVGGFARSDETFRLKNVSTGLFLCQDPRSERLELTPDGNKEECYFLFRPKKNDDQRHRIEYNELLRIQTFDGNYLQQHRGKKESGDFCGPKAADTARILFYFEQSSDELSSAANRLGSLFPCFHNFHCFLQSWGVQESTYDYARAVDSEKDLDIEIDNLKEGLENLEEFLKSRGDLSFKFKQRVLIEQRIIDILILITELIETKTGGNRVRKEMKKLEGKPGRGGEDWGYIEKSPQNIARKYLDKPIRQIYNILLLSTKNSIQVSRIILKNSSFFTRQFAYYRKEAGNLLKEAFKNSAQFDEHDPQDGNEHLIRWVGVLDMIKEVENNLPLQTLYLEIISLASLDVRMKGIVKYQNKVLQEFFSPNSHFLKGLVTFTRRNNRVYVSFARKAEITKEEFLEMNPCLTLNEINYEEYEGKCFFSLQDLSIVKNKNVELIVDYLSAVLWLFYSLCKNRNQDGINHIKGIGLQSETLMSCMQDDLIHIKLKTGFILLYEVLFIDVDPYKSIKDCSNHCYIWEEIEHKKLSEYTYLWHSLSNYNKVDWMKDYDKTKVSIINDYILDFWMNGKNIVRLEIASSHTIFSNSDSEYLQKANLIHAMLEFTKNAVNLGFTNTITNNQILYAVTNLFAAFRNDKERAVWEVDSWISKFVQSNPLSIKHEIFMQIYLEALEILEVMADLRISLQVAGFLKVFKICFENGVSLDRDSFNAVFSLFFQKYGLNVPIPKLIENVDKSMSDLDLQPVRIPVVTGIMNHNLNEVVREIANPETTEVIKSGIIFINMLNELAEKDKFLEKQTRRMLRRFFDQREALLDDLRRIEIISGKKEIEIYTEFDSQERLEIQINKVLQDDENLRQNYKIDLSSYKTRIIDINNSLNRMITRFKERKRDLKLTLKTQNIMRNLNIHISVLKILKLSYREQEHKEVFKSAISVLYYFCKANTENQRELYSDIPDLLALVEKKLKPSKLIAQIFCRKKTGRECHHFIEIIFDHLANQDPYYYINHTEYLIILRSLLIDEKKNAIHDNQRIIMSRLMKNKDFLSKLEFRIAEKTRVSEIKDEDIAILYYQAENVLLLANLCLESKLGMMQAKKTLSFEQLKTLLMNNGTPCIQKKAFLRCLFQIYITNWADLNQEFDKKNMVEVLNGIVLPDLKIFMKYLEGVIEIPQESNKVEKQKRAERLREVVKNYRSVHLEGRDEKNLVGLVSIGKKLLPPIAAGPENRKILRDPSEYWEYLNSGKSWNLKQDGLLYFIIDCFYEIDQRGWTIDEGLKDVLGQIKSSLIRMNDVLLQIEEEISKEGPQLRLSKYTVLINECIDRLPDKKAGRKGKSIHMQADGLNYNLVQGGSRNNYDRKPEEKPKVEETPGEATDPVALILQKIKSFVLKRKMTLEDFMGLFRNVEDKMNIEEFRGKLKTFLGNTVKLSEIDEFISNIRKSKRGSHELDNTVSLSKVYKKLQKSFERDRAVNYKELIKEEQGALLEDLNSPDSLNVLRSMKNFTNQYIEFNLNNEEANNELRDVIRALFSEPKKRITRKKLEEYEILLGKLLKIFNKKHYEIYLLRMLKYLLKNFEEMVTFEGKLEVNDSDSEDEDQEMQNYNAKDEFKKIQLVFAKSDALKLCLSSIREGVPKKQVFEAVEVMNFMLKTGNKQVQRHILDNLKKDSSASGFFNYIKLQLWQTVDIFKKLRETEDLPQPDTAVAKNRIILPMPKNLEPEAILDLKIAENVIRMAQLFCENCFIDFQNFLRIQVSSAKTTIVSTNLVNELSNFLVDLQLTDPNIFQNPRMFPLVSASLKALIDFCMGPCQENQKVIGSQRHLISFINSFLDKDINFQSSNDDDLQMIDTFSMVIKLLLALVNGNKDTQVKEFLLNQLSVDALIRKLVVIFTTKIANRDINIFRQERRCPQGRGGQHSHGCAENFCVINYLTPKDLLIVESGFNVYILLTIFTEEFNDNPKLEKFKYDRLNPEEKNRLYYLEAKHKTYFSDQNKKRIFNVSSDLLMQYSQTQLKKTQIHPAFDHQASKKFKFPMASLRAEDDPLFSPDNSSMEALDPSSPQPLVKKGTNRSPSFLTPMEKYRNSVVKQLINSPTDKNLVSLDRDLQRLQEEEMFKEFFSLKERYIVGKARKFFRPFINSVEVNQDGQISKNYFQVPFECDYITENIREHLIYKATRDSDIERIEHLFYNIPLYRGELEHRQKMSRSRPVEWFVKRWRFFKDLAYLAVIASNIVMLVSYDSTPGISDLSDALNKAFMIIQISLSAFILLLCVYERWPISIFKKSVLTTESSKKKHTLRKSLAIEKNQTSPYVLIARYFGEKADKIWSEVSNSRMSYGVMVLNVLFDKENLYNILYLVLSIIAFAINPLVNCILLLDIVKRSDELQDIIRSITHNLKKLLKIILLGVIIMYFYAILGLENFKDDFEEVDLNCDKLLHCWTSIINYGLRAAPGVGDILRKDDMSESEYWGRWVFDLSFFVFITIIFLYIILGIIIDTFAQLRDLQNTRLRKIEETCYICGLNKADFDTKGNGWYEHIYKEHNVYAYLNFCIYVEKKDMTECNGIEKYVKGLIEKKDISFVPQANALALQE